MPDKLARCAPPDLTRVMVDEGWVLQYWVDELGVSRETIIEAVMAVGELAIDVRERLGKQR